MNFNKSFLLFRHTTKHFFLIVPIGCFGRITRKTGNPFFSGVLWTVNNLKLHLTIVTLSWTFNETTQTYETWCCLASNFSLSWHFLSNVLKRHCSTISISNFHGKSWRYFFFFSSSPWLLFFVSVISLKHGIGWNLWNFILEYFKVWLEIFCIKHRILKVSKFLSNNTCFFMYGLSQSKSKTRALH